MNQPQRSTPSINTLQQALQADVPSEAFAIAQQLAELQPFHVSLAVDAFVWQSGKEDTAISMKRLATFEKRFAGHLDPAMQLVLADVILASGHRQEAAERYRRLVSKAPTFLAAEHRLGLIELTRAIGANLDRPDKLAERWQRPLARLLTCVWNHEYWPSWVESRAAVYEVQPQARHVEEGRERVLQWLHRLLEAQKEHAQETGKTEASDILQQLQNQLSCEQTRIRLMSDALLSLGDLAGFRDDVPLPFGLMWYQTHDAPPNARIVLQELIQQTQSIRMSSSESAEEIRTLGSELQQWFSRLAPIRDALRWGKTSAAAAGLDRLCQADDGCQIAKQSELARVTNSPKICDHACERFTYCNPGYAETGTNGLDFDLAAHQLALDVAFGLASLCARAGESRFLEATQHWRAAQQLSTVLGIDPEDFQRRLCDQAFDLLQVWSNQPQTGIVMLEHVIRAVPEPVIKGRLADRLLNEGIGFYNKAIRLNNKEDWETATLMLRKCLQLNPNTSRAFEPLVIGLQYLTMSHLEAGRVDSAKACLEEIQEFGSRAEKRMEEPSEEIPAIVLWAGKKLENWDEG